MRRMIVAKANTDAHIGLYLFLFRGRIFMLYRHNLPNNYECAEPFPVLPNPPLFLGADTTLLMVFSVLRGPSFTVF